MRNLIFYLSVFLFSWGYIFKLSPFVKENFAFLAILLALFLLCMSSALLSLSKNQIFFRVDGCGNSSPYCQSVFVFNLLQNS